MKRLSNPPAFPPSLTTNPAGDVISSLDYTGDYVTLLDYIAVQLLQAMVSEVMEASNPDRYKQATEAAYRMAHVMLSTREEILDKIGVG